MTSPKTLLNAWRIKASKRYGQNFLSNPALAEKIVNLAAVDAADVLLEIGAGLGALTIPLSKQAQQVYAVEQDHRLIQLLQTELNVRGIDNVTVLEQNILKVDLARLAETHRRRLLVMGNLPYNISSQILVFLIRNRTAVHRAVLMFQKEVSQRLIAQPGSKAYGRLSVMLQYCADVRPVLSVEAKQFFPTPKVESEIVEIRMRPLKTDLDETFFFKVVQAAFGQRRKTLKNALMGSAFHLGAATALEALSAAGIEPARRAETLTIQEFAALSSSLADRITSQPG